MSSIAVTFVANCHDIFYAVPLPPSRLGFRRLSERHSRGHFREHFHAEASEVKCLFHRLCSALILDDSVAGPWYSKAEVVGLGAVKPARQTNCHFIWADTPLHGQNWPPPVVRQLLNLLTMCKLGAL